MPKHNNDGAARGKEAGAIPEPVPQDSTADELELSQLSGEKRSILAEVAKALKTIRYGSIVLTVHDGHLVELSKTIRLRTKPAK
jgi:hypothetical protein